jgi:hypothetical protein
MGTPVSGEGDLKGWLKKVPDDCGELSFSGSFPFGYAQGQDDGVFCSWAEVLFLGRRMTGFS